MSPRKYIVEFIGTFFLVFAIGMNVLVTQVFPLAPLAIGAMLTAMVYAGGHISGAHYNPAVTVAVAMRGKCKVSDIVPYIVAQLAAAALAALAAIYLQTGTDVTGLVITNIPKVLLAEFIFTFALCFVILNVATAKGTAGNSFYGLAIGLTVTAGAFAVGPISGGVFNPAVAVAAIIMGLSAPSNIWIYLVANFAGAAVAALAFIYLNPDDKSQPAADA